MLVAAITDAGYPAGRDGVAIALDPAASEFYRDGAYRVAGQSLSSDDMIDRYAAMVDRFPVWSIEDGLGRGRLGRLGRAHRSGSATASSSSATTSSCTNPAIIADAIGRRSRTPR